ncbi:MAG: hypothetical protein KEFWMYNX_000667 [Candidatus Fervidibacter sp.]
MGKWSPSEEPGRKKPVRIGWIIAVFFCAGGNFCGRSGILGTGTSSFPERRCSAYDLEQSD